MRDKLELMRTTSAHIMSLPPASRMQVACGSSWCPLSELHMYLAQDLREMEPHVNKVGQQRPDDICELPRCLLPPQTLGA